MANGDGTFTTTASSGPMHFRDPAGAWQPIDTNLVTSDASGYAWRNGANRFATHFKDTSSSDFLRLDLAGASYGVSLDGAATQRAVVDGTRLRYPAVMPGVDLTYEATPTGVKETLVLASPDVPSTYRFRVSPLRSAKLFATQGRQGEWIFTRPGGRQYSFVLDAPVVTEEGGGPAPDRSAKPSLRVARSGTQFVADLALDSTWLHSPSRRFPVYLDPTLTIQPPLADMKIDMSCEICPKPSSDRLAIGTDTHVYRSALQFDLSGVPSGAVVTGASLQLWHDTCITNAVPCGGVAHPIEAHAITNAWGPSGCCTPLQFRASAESTFVLPNGAAPQWMSWPVASLVRDWLSGTSPNYGILLKRAPETLNQSGPTPPSRSYADPTLRPKLDVTYAVSTVTLIEPPTLHSNGADLEWTPFDPAAGPFDGYAVHRSSSATFSPSPDTLVQVVNDIATTTFRDTTAAPNRSFTYRVVVNGVASNAQTVTLPADGLASIHVQPDVSRGRDTYLDRIDGETWCGNFGADQKLLVGAQPGDVFRSLLRFDLASVPTGSAISSATLSAWRADNNEATTINVHSLRTDWVPGTGIGSCTKDGATWYDARSGAAWGVAGADFDSAVISSRALAASASPGWDDFDVTSAVTKWTSAQQPNFGLVLKSADEAAANDRVDYWSSNFTTTPSLRPQLTVSYADGSHAQAPTVALTSPTGTVSGANVPLAAAASDDRRVERVDFTVDGVAAGSDTTVPFGVEWDSTKSADGQHTIAAQAVDDAGNTATSSPTAVTVDNSPGPVTALTSPAAGATVSGSGVAVSATASDNSGISKVEFYFDDQRFGEDTTSPYSVTWDTLTSALPAYDGSRILTTKAYSTSGQVTTSAPVTVTVANTSGTKYRASIAPGPIPPVMKYDPALQTQESYPIDVAVTNNSALSWDSKYVSLIAQWQPAAGGAAISTTSYSLGSALAAGGTRTIRANVTAPVVTDDVNQLQYRLVFDLQDSQPRPTKTFASAGNAPSINPTLVSKVLKAALGLERYYNYRGTELGAGAAHLVNTASGNSLLRWTPMTAAGRGLSTVVDLTYNSLEDHSESPVGHNFSLGLSSLTRLGNPIDIHPNNADTIAGRATRWIALTDSDGTTHRFNGQVHADGTVYWQEPAGVHLYLRKYSTTDLSKTWALTRPDRVTFFYNDQGFPTGVEDRNGNRLAYTLETTPPADDPGGPKQRVTTVTDAAGRTFGIDYFTKAEVQKAPVRGKVQRITDHSGAALDFDYYEDGNLLRLTERGGTKADGSALVDRSIVFTYTNSAGDAAAITDPALRVNPDPRTPNQSTRLYSVRDPRGKETRFTYYGPTSGKLRWKLNTVTDRTGAVTTYSYDVTNRITTVTAPLSRVTKYTHDVDGKVTTVNNPKNESTTVTW
ncbi:MAG: DNRLRE domain-containing protein, partial [Frankia sp.]|nr:DNRLRE domain-containing protein [Frankia sp.]